MHCLEGISILKSVFIFLEGMNIILAIYLHGGDCILKMYLLQNFKTLQ